MADEEITLYYNRRRLDALRVALEAQCQTLGEELYSKMDALYESLVSAQERARIETEIVDDMRKAEAAKEASRRFTVFHVLENGKDSYFTSDHFRNFLAAAYRYRLYSRNELDSHPDNLRDAYIETIPITKSDFNNLASSISEDFRIQGVFDFDIDNGNVTICTGHDNYWRTYDLRDVSVAVFKAERSDYRAGPERERIFDNALAGKEIDQGSAPVSDELQSMQM